MRRSPVILALAVLTSATACSDAIAPARSPSTALTPGGSPQRDESEGRGVFQRYVAIGTSLSMGWQSDGVIAATQETSWPAQLAAMAHRSITQPYIQEPGCRSPLYEKLITFARLSGEPAGAPTNTLSCAPLRDDVVQPVQNLAINAATTYDALFTTPENTTDDSNRGLISRVLQPHMTQVSSMLAQNPKFVSVELGGNEVLNARNGVAIEGVSMYPFAAWAPLYDRVLDEVGGAAQEAVVVGLIDDVASFPAFRRGYEMAAERATFKAAFNVDVAANCDDNQNLLFVPLLVPTAVGTGLYLRQNKIPASATLSCAAKGPTDEDNILTPDEVAKVNDLLARMDAHIRQQAETRHFAYFALQSLYGRPDIKGPFDVVALMTSTQPYGPFLSLDGVHPSAAGARVLAEAAARAIDERYHHGISTPEVPLVAAQ